MIDLDKLDPDWKFASRHGRASKTGIPINLMPTTATQIYSPGPNNTLICKCCYEHVYKSPVSLWENSKQLQFLGFGFPLFYQFLKNCIILLLLATFSYNALAIKQSMEDNYQLCHGDHNTTTHRLLASSPQTPKMCFTFMVQISRIQQTITSQEQALRIISFVLMMLALLYIRNRVTKLQEYYDERTTSLSDYSIIIKGLPRAKGIQKTLKQFFKKQFKQPHQIKQITLLPQYDQIQDLQAEKKAVINSLRKHYEKINTQQLSISEQQQMNLKLQDLQYIDSEIRQAAFASKDMAFIDELLCQKVICVFNSSQQKQDILQQFSTISLNKKKKYFGQQSAKQIYAKQAPQPEQIIWETANLPRRKRVLYIMLGWGLSILVLVALFIIFFLILQKKSLVLEAAVQEIAHNPQNFQAGVEQKGSIALVYILLFLVVIFDKIVMSTLFHKFTDLQRHSTTSKFQFSFQLKLLLGMFFTTALMTLAVQAIRFQNYYKYPYGVIDEQTIMFFMNSLFVPIFWLINPTRIFKKFKIQKNFGKKQFTQKEANELMEQQTYDMGKRFAEILEMMWFTFLYSTLIPVGVIITTFGLFCYYWVDKYNLLRRSAVSGHISGKIINYSLTLLDCVLIMRPVGCLIFDSQIRQSYKPSSIVMLIVGIIYIILPKNKLIKFFNDEKFRLQQKTYQQVKNKFHKTYHTQHPIYRLINSQKLTNKMLRKGLSFDENADQTQFQQTNSKIFNLNQSKQLIFESKFKQKTSEIQLGVTSILD